MPSSSEDSNFAANDNASIASSMSEAAQYTEAIPRSDSSTDASSGHLGDNDLLDLPPPIADDSDEDPTFLPERPRRDAGKAVADEPQHDSSSEPDAMETSQSFKHIFEDRPNRFLGPSSTWYTWTKDERNVADFLSNERASNLSAHLFNAFALKSRARQHRINAMTGEAADIADDTACFKPPKVWTAWPLPPEEVPRESQKLIWDPSDPTIYRMSPDLRPSMDLEETCIASCLHFAKDKFNDRETDISTSEPDLDGTRSPPTRGTMQNIGIKAEEMPAVASPIAESTDNSDLLFNEVYTSQPYESGGRTDDKAILTRSQEVAHEIAHEDMHPIFIADDDNASTLLRPITRGILDKLDDLLTNLHTIRSSYATQKSGSRLERDSQTDTAAIRFASPFHSSRKKDTPLPHMASRSEASDGESSSQSRRTKNMRSSHRMPHDVQIGRLALCDWSEILGTASVTGWTPDIVARASKRCAALFGEDMLFRTFHEGADKKGETAYFAEQTASGKEPVTDFEAPLHPSGWFTEPESESEVESDIHFEGDGPKDFHCAVRDCERRHRPFANWYQLQKHIKDFHRLKRGPKRGSRRVATTSETEITETEIEETTYSEKTYDCPVDSCNRAQQPFNRLPNLYNHIRKKHRTFDVERFKKLQSQKRSEERGRRKDHGRKRIRLRGTTPFPGGTSELDTES
ncbi:MAG: hypothetical protein Q9160_008834 [Pyrenula sp. 1 TL-2023]